jgi:hypothetical protein
MKSSVLFDQTYKQFLAIAVENWSSRLQDGL